MHRCSAVDPKVIMGELSVVFNLAAMGLYRCFVAVLDLFISGVSD